MSIWTRWICDSCGRNNTANSKGIMEPYLLRAVLNAAKHVGQCVHCSADDSVILEVDLTVGEA